MPQHVKQHALILVNQITRGDPDFQEKLCLVGPSTATPRAGPRPLPDYGY